jgi:hypothetical protein
MSISVIHRAENYMCDSYEYGDSLPEELVWEWILEAASEDDRFTDEDGEWLPGVEEALEDPLHPLGKECDEANAEALGYMEGCVDEWNEPHPSLTAWERNQ